jgi:DNA replication protein DnaC
VSATDPQPIGDRLAEQVARLAAAQQPEPQLHRATTEALLPDDYDDLPTVGQLLEHKRMATWQRAIPNRFQWADLADFTDQPPDVQAGLEEWAAKPDRRNLLLLGPVGVGKTHAAVAACRRQHFDSGTDVRFLPVVELLDLLRPGGPEGALYDLADTDLLVLDDLGSERPTEWTAERLYALINRRWLEARPTVCTTNLEPDPLRDAVGERVFSRLVGNGAVVLRLTGHDRRRKRRGE